MGVHYVVLNLTASGLFLIGLAMLYSVTGTLNMTDMALRVARLTGDAALLAHHFKNKFSSQESRSGLHFSSEAMTAIETYGWPGNVREMENCIKRAVIMADGPSITADDLGLADAAPEDEPLNLRQVRDEAEYKALVKALARVDGNIVKASELLGISRPTMYDLMARHNIKNGD